MLNCVWLFFILTGFNDCFFFYRFSHLDFSFDIFFLNFGGIACGVVVLNAALCLFTRAGKLKYLLYPLSKWRSNPQPNAFIVARLHSCTITGLIVNFIKSF